MRDEQAHEPATETVSLGGTTGGGRLSALIRKLSPRQQATMMAGSTLLLGVVVLATVILAGTDTDAPTRQADDATPEGALAAPVPAAPTPGSELEDGRVWVGYHGVMLAVPRSWAHTNSASCGTTKTRAAPPPRAPHSKCSAQSPRQRSIVLWLRQDVDPSDLLDNSFFESSMHGRSVFMTTIQKAGSIYLQYVALPDTDTLVVVRSPHRSTIAQLVHSLRGIPQSWVTVPELRSKDPQEALNELAELDLLGRAAHNSGMVLPADTVVVNQNPAEGQVVPPRTPVTIAVLPASVPSEAP